VACPALQNFSTLSHKSEDFLKKFLNKNVFQISLWLLCETFLILRKVEQDIKNICWYSCAVPLLSDFSERLIFLTDFKKILKYQIS